MTQSSKTLKIASLSAFLLLTSLLTACATAPDGPAPNDQLIFQVCLRNPPMANLKQLDFTIVRNDKREVEPALAIGTSVKKQPIFEAIADDFRTIKTTVLSTDRSGWYAFENPTGARLDAWSDWQSANYMTRTEDTAYKLEHGLPIEKEASGADAVKIRYRMMHYKDMLAARAARRFELPRDDFAPC